MPSPPPVSTLLIAGAITLFGLTAVTVAQAAPAAPAAPSTSCHAPGHPSGTPETSVKHSSRLVHSPMRPHSGLHASGDKIGCETA